MHDLLDQSLDIDDREAALERAFTQHDSLMFMGEKLKPLSIATFSLMQRAGIKILGARMEIMDIAGFILLHSSDEKKNREARSAVWRGVDAWSEYVFKYLEGNPDIMEHIIANQSVFLRMLEDFVQVQTKSMSSGELKKKSGIPTG